MSKLDEKVEKYTQETKSLGLKIPSDFLAKVTKGLGPSIYKKDAETISCTQSSELDTVKKNFLGKKLGLSDDSAMDKAIKEVCEEMGTSNKSKYRAIFYALLAQKFDKQSIYS
jgi:hypothetical protein